MQLFSKQLLVLKQHKEHMLLAVLKAVFPGRKAKAPLAIKVRLEAGSLGLLSIFCLLF